MTIKRLNTGKSAESLISTLCFFLERRGLGRIEKVDPPTKVIGKKAGRRIIWLSNPFLDYIGVYQARPITFEVKDIDRDLLPIDALKGDGLKTKQVANIRRWHAAGMVTGLVWFRRGEARIYTGPEILEAVDAGAKSLPWDGAHRVEVEDVFNELIKLQ